MSRLRGIVVKSAAPTVTDDVDAGYYAGFTWIDDSTTIPTWYVCLDASKSAAVWQAKNVSSGGFLPFNSELTVPAINIDQNDWLITNLAVNSFIRISANNPVTITGILSQGLGARQTFLFLNEGSFDFIFSAENPASSPANRILTNGDIILNRNEAAWFIYDTTASRWRITGTGI